MKERPILFSAPMVRALLAGTKTVTRRMVRIDDRPITKAQYDALVFQRGIPSNAVNVRMLGYLKCDAPAGSYTVSSRVNCPHGIAGDRLWVRETFYCDDYRYPDGPREELIESLEYRADHDCRNWEAGCPCSDDNGRSGWRPSIFLPRWASRISLDVTGVRVERLHDITEEQARAEGVITEACPGFASTMDLSSCRDAFRALWSEINGAESWDANPWVWAIEFKPADVERQVVEQLR